MTGSITDGSTGGPAPSKHPPLAAIVGGVIGGVVVILVTCVSLYLYRRRRQGAATRAPQPVLFDDAATTVYGTQYTRDEYKAQGDRLSIQPAMSYTAETRSSTASLPPSRTVSPTFGYTPPQTQTFSALEGKQAGQAGLPPAAASPRLPQIPEAQSTTSVPGPLNPLEVVGRLLDGGVPTSDISSLIRVMAQQSGEERFADRTSSLERTDTMASRPPNYEEITKR